MQSSAEAALSQQQLPSRARSDALVAWCGWANTRSPFMFAVAVIMIPWAFMLSQVNMLTMQQEHTAF